MKKQQILDEIRRTAASNGGAPLGKKRFFEATGIKDNDWFGKYWVRWSEAIQEAGLAPNKMQAPHSEELLMSKYIALIRELGRMPTNGDLLLKRRQDPQFPSHNTFNRLGPKAQIVAKVVDYCRPLSGFEDVFQLCISATSGEHPEPLNPTEITEVIGFVYLLKSGKYYKIGRTNALGRREYELAIQLPEATQTVHAIRTDDPAGIEAYWHARFAAKRTNGEWFGLAASDVQAFRRRKFM